MTDPIYSTVLFDLDHTLFDTDASEALAFEYTLRLAGVSDPGAHFAAYDRINKSLWAAVERQEITPGEVRTERFEQLVALTGLDADPSAIADNFADGLARFGTLYPGAFELLERLAESVSLALVTNGLSDVQRGRIERLGIAEHFDAVIISAEVGASKPGRTIFDVTFGLLGGPPRTSALMVGDSLSSDIQGGTNSGISTCWYNPHRTTAATTDRFDHEITSLEHLPAIVFGI